MNDYLYGKINGLRIRNIADSLFELLPNVDYVVVRSIDSTVATEALEKIMIFNHLEFQKSNGNILLSRKAFFDSLKRRIFSGFDELWFFQGEGPKKDLTGLPRATADSEDFSVSVPSEIVQAAHETHCLFLAGDGNGLNYLTPDSAIFEALTKLCLPNSE